MKDRILKHSVRIALYVFLFALSVVFLYPFLYMIINSLKTNEDLNNFTVVWLPRTLHFANYKMAAEIMDYFGKLKNSLIITLIATLGQLISCSMAGYSLARYNYRGKGFMSVIVILAMLVPAQTIIVPQYLLYSNLGWLNTYMPLTVPAFFGYGFKGALYIFIFRQFFLGLPRELEEASRVDGCGFIRTYVYIIFPTARAPYLITLVLATVWHWSNYFEPGMYLSDSAMLMVSQGLKSLSTVLTLSTEALENTYSITDENALNNAVLMAATFMVVLPLIVMFAFLQRKFVQSIERTGLTGE